MHRSIAVFVKGFCKAGHRSWRSALTIRSSVQLCMTAAGAFKGDRTVAMCSSIFRVCFLMGFISA